MASYDIILKRGDTRNCIKAILKDSEGSPINLTGCVVNFCMAPLNKNVTIARKAHVQDEVGGEVWFVWAPGDTDVDGLYQAEFKIVYQDGRKETLPNNSYIIIKILKDLR